MIIDDEDKISQSELEEFGYRQELNRSMNVWQLTAFGLNYMIPIAPAIVFGFILQASGGSVALPYLLAGVAMSFTAISYGILVKKYPIAGSLYSYVSRAMHGYIGFIAGWILLLDYLLIPTVTSISTVLYIREMLPQIPYAIVLTIFILSTGMINLLGIKLMARLGLWLLLIGEIVIFTGFAIWSYGISYKGIGVGHLLSLEPFRFYSMASLATAASVASLSYLGFDAITTLAEEAHSPRRDIPRAILFSVIIGGFTMVLTGYIAMLVIPNWQEYKMSNAWLSTALFYITEITGGKVAASFYASGFVLAMGVFNVVATAAGSRLLFGMGRDGVLPRKIFGVINMRWKTPHWNIVIITLLEIILGLLFTVDSITDLVNYGALLGFILLNISVIWHFYVKKQRNKSVKKFVIIDHVAHFVCPLLGALILIWIFSHMRHITLLLGSVWLLIGATYGIFRFNYAKPK